MRPNPGGRRAPRRASSPLLRDGAWATHARVLGYCRLLVAAWAAACAIWIAVAGDVVDPLHRPIGTDFSNVYAAGKLARDGAPAAAFDIEAHFAMQRFIFDDPEIATYGWHYPPPFLFVASALAPLPYAWALGVWMAASFALYLFAADRLVGERFGTGASLLAAAAFPAVFVVLGHGQNAFLSAGLFGLGLAWLGPRPLLAGAMFGLLTYKPHLGVFVPFAFAAAGLWRPFASAAATALGMALLSFLVFGAETWTAFFESLSFTREIVLEEGATGFFKMQSLFAALSMWGLPTSLAYVGHGALVLALAAPVWIAWRAPERNDLAAGALLCAACVLASPYALDYDLAVLGVAIALLARAGAEEGFRPYEASLLAFAFAAPLLARPAAAALGLPVGLAAGLGVFAFAAARCGVVPEIARIARRRTATQTAG